MEWLEFYDPNAVGKFFIILMVKLRMKCHKFLTTLNLTNSILQIATAITKL